MEDILGSWAEWIYKGELADRHGRKLVRRKGLGDRERKGQPEELKVQWVKGIVQGLRSVGYTGRCGFNGGKPSFV